MKTQHFLYTHKFTLREVFIFRSCKLVKGVGWRLLLQKRCNVTPVKIEEDVMCLECLGAKAGYQSIEATPSGKWPCASTSTSEPIFLCVAVGGGIPVTGLEGSLLMVPSTAGESLIS